MDGLSQQLIRMGYIILQVVFTSSGLQLTFALAHLKITISYKSHFASILAGTKIVHYNE
jgi:hypothetical protein